MTWRKSSYSGQDGDCIEVRDDLSALRDSKNPDGSTLNTTGVRHMVLFLKARTRDSVVAQEDL